MKCLIILLIFFSTVQLQLSANAQNIRFGVRAGLSLASSPQDIRQFSYQAKNYELQVNDIPAGFHFGLVLQARSKRLVFQPELLFHSTRTDYALSEIFNSEIITTISTERFSHVELPLIFAYRLGPMRLQAGPVGRVYIASSSELTGLLDYKNDYRDYAIGYQAGIGFDIFRFQFDFKYDGSFEGLGSNINIAGRALSFGKTAGRTFVTVGYILFE